ncbi:MAG: outer membrane beta-barrel protein [bacterium]
MINPPKQNKFYILCLCLCFSLQLAHAQSSSDDDFVGQYYISAMGGGYFAKTSALDTGSQWSVQLGYRSKLNSAVEIEVSQSKSNLLASDQSLSSHNINANYIFINPEPLWNPYFTVGAGVRNMSQTTSTAVAKVSVGGFWTLTPQKMMLRAEVGVEYSDSRQSELDGLDSQAQVGILIPF